MDIKKVFITDDVNCRVAEGLRAIGIVVDQCDKATPQRITEIIHEYDALIVRSRTKITREIIEAGSKLKVIARAGVGVDNVDVAAASERSVLVINAPNGNTISACELTCALILSISRNLYNASKLLKDGVWNRKDFFGHEVDGKTLGVIGMGRVGQKVAKRMKAFEMNIIGYDPFMPADKVDKDIEVVGLNEIWERSDYITLHVPLLPSTKHLVNKETIAKCKKGVMIINVARGGTVDEEALLEGLTSRHVHAAALDVFEEEPPMNEELIRNQYLTPTPHLGACSHEAQLRVAEEILDELIKLRQGQAIPGAVNADRLNIQFLKR